MFCDVGAMQISAANLLQAGQQAKPAQAPQASAFGNVLNAKKAEGAAAPDGFESMLFKQAAAPASAPAASAAAGPAQPYAAMARPGSQLDIKV